MTIDPQLISRIDELLPQTQCRQCGYAGCRPYAEAIAAGATGINHCPPGGDGLARELADLLKVVYEPVDTSFGVTKPPAVAVIDEALCIGCTLCIQACPVDAIVGATKLMHTVIARDCTGCELCLPPCPVACINMVETGVPATNTRRRLAAEHARERFQLHTSRLDRKSQIRRSTSLSAKQLTVQRAIIRAKSRLARRKQPGK